MCVLVCLVFCGPIDSLCKCHPFMMSQLPSESTCHGGRCREKGIWSCWFLSGKGVSAIEQFKYVELEELLSTSLPHCCASVHNTDCLFQWIYAWFDMYNFLGEKNKNKLVTVPYRWRRMRSWEELMINAVSACVWFRPTIRRSETSWKRWRNQMACEYTVMSCHTTQWEKCDKINIVHSHNAQDWIHKTQRVCACTK